MANPNKSNTQLADKSGDGLISDRQSAIPACVDSLDGATFTGDTLTTSATPTVDELEANDGVLAGKINAIILVLEAHGLVTAN